MEVEKYKLMEIASIIGLSKSTVYQWMKFFQPFFQPFQVKIGKGIGLNKQGLELFQQIKIWKDDGNTTLEIIRERLGSEGYRPGWKDAGISGIESESSELMSIREENRWLKEQLEKANQELSETRKRQDTIILQLTRQLENQQNLLEYHQTPFWKRWFRKHKSEIG